MKEQLDQKIYEQSKQALKLFLCAYFSTGTCTQSQGTSIVPIGATPSGGKILKVRWALPGQGKMGRGTPSLTHEESHCSGEQWPC